MDASFPNGVYNFSTGQNLNLAGDAYPAAAKVLSVNGMIPTWTNGMLLLDSKSNNNIAWSAYSNSSISFVQGGLELIDVGCTDYSDLSGNFGSVTNIVLCPVAGLGKASQTNLMISAGKVKPNANYLIHISYGSLTSLTNRPVLSGIGYLKQTTIQIITK